ncbi:hypothetical protein DLH98_23550 [Vibrio parahaemolyticus]|nr:hypothetical protein [Vibrio parahaemolyticus]EGR2948255.1 hypothetical protein [Vibrio parahaemolyticus]EGR3067721.1 hypothetical protein [Vibrio parahaemolyticus]EHH1218451.1 hypothetical protein [Vibrio parahaemolyticus]EHK2889253.1 hypothetical protein [Vibrio parahaemolyticus]
MKTGESQMYLVIVMDLYSRRVVGWPTASVARFFGRLRHDWLFKAESI